MAIYSLDVNTVARANGRSAVHAAAYIRRDARVDQRTGLGRDYSRSAYEVLAAGVVGPVDWQAAERAERRRDAVVARTIILALPHELPVPELARLVDGYCRWLREEHRVALEWAVHEAPTKNGGDPRNRHGHVELTSRRVDAAGTFGEKTRELDDRARGSQCIRRWRQAWEEAVNLALAEHGSAARVDCRSLTARGILRPPHRHLGPEGTQRQRRGYSTAATRHNQGVTEWVRLEAGDQRRDARGAARPDRGVGGRAAACHAGDPRPDQRRQERAGESTPSAQIGASSLQAAATREADRELRPRAKREIDLAAFLGACGWRSVPGKDTPTSRCLVGPDGSRVIISRAREDEHWQWFDARTGVGGSIVDACTKLLGLRWGEMMGVLRRSLAHPPASLPVVRGVANSSNSHGRHAAAPANIAGTTPECERSHSVAVVPPASPTLQPLGTRGRAYLTERRHLDARTVSTFASTLRENTRGSVRALHSRQYDDGEERGENWKSFVGSQADGEGRGRGLWVAFPARHCSRLLVAESFVSALSAWELLPEDQRRITAVASTAGTISVAGAARLERVLTWLRNEQVQRGGKQTVWLLDASDQGEASTEARTTFLNAMAEQAGVGYWRYQPPGESQDWNDALAAAKEQPPYQDTLSKPAPQQEPAYTPSYLQAEETLGEATTKRNKGLGR